MEDEGDSGICESPEGLGSVALLAFRKLLTELLAIELPSIKVGQRHCCIAVHVAAEGRKGRIVAVGCGAAICDTFNTVCSW